jgi:hypothetical protein
MLNQNIKNMKISINRSKVYKLAHNRVKYDILKNGLKDKTYQELFLSWLLIYMSWAKQELNECDVTNTSNYMLIKIVY